MADQLLPRQTQKLSGYIEAVVVEVLAGIIASGVGWLVIWLWDSNPLYVFLGAVTIVLVTMWIAARAVIARQPLLKNVIPITLVLLLVAEVSVSLLFWTQLTRVPNMVGVNPSQVQSLIEQANLMGKTSSARCGDQEKNVTFQDPPPDAIVMKRSTIQIVNVLPTIEITSPISGTSVAWKQVVTGNSCGVAASGLHLYVLIHPLDTYDWWVQPGAIVDTDGQWRATCQFGNDQYQGTGAEYEAIAITTSELAVGKYGVELPRHLAHSQVVTVKKGR